MSKDNGSEPRRRVSWLPVASLIVAVARLLLDVWRRDGGTETAARTQLECGPFP